MPRTARTIMANDRGPSGIHQVSGPDTPLDVATQVGRECLQACSSLPWRVVKLDQ